MQEESNLCADEEIKTSNIVENNENGINQTEANKEKIPFKLTFVRVNKPVENDDPNSI